MVIVSVVYPTGSEARFDVDYYLNTHTPMLRARWGEAGLDDVRVLRGVEALGGGEAPHQITCLLTFRSGDHLRAAVTGEHAAEIMGDIPKFTNIQPLIQVNERLV